MDPTRFDRLAKHLADHPLSRRAMTKGGAGLAAAALTGGGAAAALARQVSPAAGTAPPATPVTGTGAPATTAILVGATNKPLRVAGSDGADHLEYDLIITNALPAPLTLTAIEVLGPAGTRLLHLAGDALVQATQPLIGLTPTAQIPAFGAVAVVIDVIVPHGQAVARLSHRISYAYPATAPAHAAIEAFTVSGPTLAVNPRPAIVLAPPLHGDNWLVANSCCSPASEHRSVRLPVDGQHIAKQEMFAIDFVLMRNGQLYAGNGATPVQWYDFGAEVLAVADGTVVAVRDDMPEETPLQPVQHVKRPADYGGNNVIMALTPGVYAIYAHMQPGSITVHVGEKVTTGQMLGKVGNTGNTDAPHLHFGLLDAPDPLAGTTVPMVFARYTLAGMVTPAGYATAAAATPPGGQSPTLPVTGPPQEQTATLPLYTAVVNFP
jgi:Peptidase family M23